MKLKDVKNIKLNKSPDSGGYRVTFAHKNYNKGWAYRKTIGRLQAIESYFEWIDLCFKEIW